MIMGFRVFGLAGFKKMRSGLAGERMHVGLRYSRTLLPRRIRLQAKRYGFGIRVYRALNPEPLSA